jgi:hypothetical protein
MKETKDVNEDVSVSRHDVLDAINKFENSAKDLSEPLAEIQEINDPKLKNCIEVIADLQETFIHTTEAIKKYGWKKSLWLVRNLAEVCKHCILSCRRFEYRQCLKVITLSQEVVSYLRKYNVDEK